jgi:hypothetical protein
MRWGADPRDEVRAFGLLYAAVGVCGVVLLRLAGELLGRRFVCPLRVVTGLPCPGCGGTHAALALAAGDLPRALAANPLVTLGLLAWAAWGLFALLATIAPHLRGRPVLGRHERLAVRLLAVTAVAAQWGWMLAQRRG